MIHHLPARLGIACLFVTALVNCSSATPEPADADEPEVSQARSAVLVQPPHCYGKMLKPTPLELEQPLGQPMTLRVNRACDLGAPLVARKLRIYIKGATGPQRLLVDWTDWAGGTYRFESAWTAGRLLDGTDLAPGRYQIFSYAINASDYEAWLANDLTARASSRRSDNTYVELRAAGTWSSSVWGACSASCDGGTQTRANQCDDPGGSAYDSRMCLEAAPASTQACNTAACTYSWTTGNFGACSASCGGGTQSRSVTCSRDSDGASVSDDLCDAGTRPATSQACNTSSCVSNSCLGYCGTNAPDYSCYCDSVCTMAGDCCADYSAVCQ